MSDLEKAWKEYEAARGVGSPGAFSGEELRVLNAAVYVALQEWRRWRTLKEKGLSFKDG